MTETPAPTRSSPAALLVFTGVLAGFALVVFGAGSWAGTAYSNLRTASVVAALAGTMVWLALALGRPSLRPRSQLSGAFAAALGAFAATALPAWNVRLSVDFLGYAVLLTACYLLLVRLCAAPGMAARLTVLATVTCAGTGIAFLIATGVTWMNFWTQLGFRVPPLRLTYEGLWLGSPNVLAAFQVLMLAAAVPGLVALGRRGTAITLMLGALTLAVVFVTASRGAWLGLGLAVVVTGLAWLASPAARSAAHAAASRDSGRLPVLATAGVAGIAILAAAVWIGPNVLARLADVSGAGVRAAFLAASARMLGDSPLTGQGPGSWTPARLTFTEAAEPDYYIPHAHNVPAQVGAEFGVVGLVAGVVVVALVLRMVVRGLRHDSRLVRLSGFAALFACVFLAGQQLVDAFVHQPAILVAFALPLARLDAQVTAGEADPPAGGQAVDVGGRRLVLTAVLAIAVVVGAWAALWPEDAARAHERAVAAADEGRWTDAAADAATTVAADPALAPYQFVRGLAAAASGDLEVARNAFAAAAALDDLPSSWLNLAAVQARLGHDSARTSLDRALRLGRQQPQIAVAAADLYRQLGDDATAGRLLEESFAMVPSLAGDPLWSTPEWKAIASAAIDRGLAGVPTWTSLLLALEAGRADEATRIAVALDPAAGSLAQVAPRAWLGDRAAFDSLHGMATANPLDATTVGLCLRIARLHGTDGTASGWSCDGDWWFGVYPIARTGPAADAGPLPGPAAFPHWLFAYRRPGPADQLVSWLLHLHATLA